jgi:hypothetical protein
MSMNHLFEIGVGKSNGNATSGPGLHLAAEFTSSQNTQKPSQIDEKCRTTYMNSGSGNKMMIHSRTRTPPSGRGNEQLESIVVF